MQALDTVNSTFFIMSSDNLPQSDDSYDFDSEISITKLKHLTACHKSYLVSRCEKIRQTQALWTRLYRISNLVMFKKRAESAQQCIEAIEKLLDEPNLTANENLEEDESVYRLLLNHLPSCDDQFNSQN